MAAARALYLANQPKGSTSTARSHKREQQAAGKRGFSFFPQRRAQAGFTVLFPSSKMAAI